MKSTTAAGFVILILGSAFVRGDDDPPILRIRPIHFVSSDDVPVDLDSRVKPPGFKTGFQIYYLVKGKEIAGFESLVIDSIKTTKGVDLSRNWNGTRSYKAGSVPKVSEDRKYCVFSLEVPRKQIGKLDQLEIRGYATILTGSDRMEKSIDLAGTNKGVIKEGPFTIEVARTPAAPTKSVDSLSVHLKGPIKRLIDVKFSDGDAEIQSAPNGNEIEQTHLLLLPASGKVMMTIRYWGATNVVAVPVGKPGDSLYHHQLQQILEEIHKERERQSPDFDAIRKKAADVGKEVAQVMRNEASIEYPAKQALLWAARDELPRMMQFDLLTESKYEQNFALRLDEAAYELGLKSRPKSRAVRDDE